MKWMRQFFCHHAWRDIRIELRMSSNWVDSYFTVKECTKCKKQKYVHSHYSFK